MTEQMDFQRIFPVGPVRVAAPGYFGTAGLSAVSESATLGLQGALTW